MRKDVRNQINELFNKYKTIELEKIDTSKEFVSIEPYRVKTNDGNIFYRDKIVKNNGYGSSSSILPILKNNNVLLVVEPRVFTKNTVEISMPGGYIDRDETSLEAAKRELEEETGLVSSNIELVSEYYSDLGNSDHISSVYIAFDCEPKGKIKYDSDEFISCIEITIDELIEVIDTGIIKNSATIIASLKLKEILKNKKVI